MSKTVKFTKVSIDNLVKDENILVIIKEGHTGKKYDYSKGRIINFDFVSGKMFLGTFSTEGWNETGTRFFVPYFIFYDDYSDTYLYPHTDKCEFYKFNWQDFFPDVEPEEDV